MNTPATSELVHIVFKATVKEELVEEFLKIIHNDMVETRKEQGNLRTEFMRDREKKNVFHIYDVYFN